MSSQPGKLNEVGKLVALLLAVCLSFWLSPAPKGQVDVEYWGHYVKVGPGLGFVVNHDTDGYLAVAKNPAQLMQPQETRQSRPLWALLGAAVGYPLTAALRLAGRVGLAPKWWPEDTVFYGFYSGYVLLNGLLLLASLLLLRHLWRLLTAGKGEGWQFYALAWVLVANPLTKAFFWTAHQQVLAFLVPLFCVALAARLGRRPVPGWAAVAAWSLGLGLLPLVYGSFVLVWPVLAFGLLWPRPGQALASKELLRDFGQRKAGKLLLSAGLFAAPTLLWIALLQAKGVTYYNHETVRYHQLVWLLEARHLPLPAALSLVAAKLWEYLGSLQLLWGWLLLGAGLYVATRWHRPAAGTLLPPVAGPALAWLAACFGGFFALLGYYPERLAYTLLPLVLCLLGALLPYWPRRYARPAALGVAAAWYLYTLLSYGPFS